ncbi:MAG: thiamine diphosphokinase [Acidaminococcales bacterium]|nr:thiamine diphosphokinase [Acidaminococcales bacterium]
MRLTLPQYEITMGAESAGEKKRGYILVAGGRAPATAWLSAAAAGRAAVCADRGVSYCRRAGLVPEAVIGDADSAGEDWQWARGEGARTLRYPADKDRTDLALALIYLKKQKDCGSLVASGVLGGRFDHAFSALFTLSAYRQGLGCPLIAADQYETLIFAGRAEKISVRFFQRPEVISLLPLSGRGRATLTGCRWELQDGLLCQSRPYAVSNRLKEGRDGLSFEAAGKAGIYCCFAEGAL